MGEHTLPDDHIDLVVTAAMSWGVLSGASPLGSGSPLENQLLTGLGQHLGDQIRVATTPRGHIPHPGTYHVRQVDPHDLIPVAVIKAVHAVRHATTHPTEDLTRRLRALETAAITRLPGYATAPWTWTRPHHRDGPAVIITTDQDPLTATGGPSLPHLSPDRAHEVWDSASMILIRPHTTAHLTHLPARSDLYVLSTPQEQEEAWAAVQNLTGPPPVDLAQQPAALCDQVIVLTWPACRQWLTDQLATPTCSLR